MSNQEDKEFMTRFVVVLSVLVLLAAVFFLAARLISVMQNGAISGDMGVAAQARVDERIRPVGRVVTAETETGDDTAAPTRRSGSEIYGGACAACHDTGAAGAPRKGDEGVWADRLGQGLDTLVKHAIEGIGAMPARGGNPSLSDEDVRAAVVYLLEQSGQSVDDGDSQAAATKSEAPQDAPGNGEGAASAAGDASAGQARYSACIACHGAQGQGQGIFPKLAGSDAQRIAELLKKYRAGEQVGANTALMAPIAKGLSDQDIADLAAYIGSL